MAKKGHRGGKKKREGKKKGHRKNPRRVAAAKKAYRKMKREGRGIAGKHKRGKKKSRGGKKKSRGGKKKGHRATGGHGHGVTYYRLYQQAIDRGRSPHAAHKVAARAERMVRSRLKRNLGGIIAEERKAAAAAKAAKAAGEWGDVWGRIGRVHAAGL